MLETLPKLGEALSENQVSFLKTLTKSARQAILQMVTNAQSGHPGGALSCIDYLATLYAFRVAQTGEKVVVSNGHVSPCVYATLAEMGYIPRQEVIEGFRKAGKIYEGHITRHVDGVEYGTGPLGVGVSVSSAFAHAEKLKGTEAKSFFLMGDGECQEGQVHEMIENAYHHKLNNLIGFVDYNKVQLTASLKDTLEIDVIKFFEGGQWEVIECNAHDFQDIWRALGEAMNATKPVVIIGHSIMGQGSDFMQPAGEAHDPAWHGKAPGHDDIASDISALETSDEEKAALEAFRNSHVTWHPKHAEFPEKLSKTDVNPGKAIEYEAGTVTDCRSAYGKALLDLAKNNEKVIALTADLKGSVKTDGVSKELPAQYVECGIAEQHMISAAGGFSLSGFTPFASTFGAFISSRAKDQARVNDINYCNVKMVATHCGLSVGEDGPTHQAIDDMGSFLGFYNTHVIEPADANQCDRIIRYVASHFGNFYVRMGRHKFEVLTKEDGTPFYDANYQYEYGRSDIIREGSDITIAASGSMVSEALKAREALEGKLSIEVVAVSSIKEFDETLINSIKKTGKLITAEDHNPACGLGTTLPAYLAEQGIQIQAFKAIGVREYQLSGKQHELYEVAGIDSTAIVKASQSI